MIKTPARYSDAPSHQPRYVHIMIASRDLQTSRAWASQVSIQTAGVPALAVLDIAGGRNGIFAASAQPLLRQIGAPAIAAARPDLYKARPIPDRGERVGLRNGPALRLFRDR
jgi:hypothetical protein